MVYYDFNTKNQSFIDTHRVLMGLGVKNNAFHLALLDTDLLGVDPLDEASLTSEQKLKIHIEIRNNYFYFLREILRVPGPSGLTFYKCDIANISFNYICMYDFNIIYEVLRQKGKTTTCLARILYEFSYVSINNDMLLHHIDQTKSSGNLSRITAMRDALPEYLRVDNLNIKKGSKKSGNSSLKLYNAFTNCNVIAQPKASSEQKADSIGRGSTTARQYLDEAAFISYLKVILAASTPASLEANRQAKRIGNPHGRWMSTTPNNIHKYDEAKYVYDLIRKSIKFNHTLFDLKRSEIEALVKNTHSSYIYISYYKDDFNMTNAEFENIVHEMDRDWDKIKREILGSWDVKNNNSPFNQQDIDAIEDNVVKPIEVKIFNNIFELKIFNNYEYERLRNLEIPSQIIGVDVAGSESRGDDTAMVIIDSKTTKVTATLHSNLLDDYDTSAIITELWKLYPTNVTVIERNGGFGSSIITRLKRETPNWKQYLYFEDSKDATKDKVSTNIELVKTNGGYMRNYGIYTDHNKRIQYFEILRKRTELHKTKFMCHDLYSELRDLIVTKNGRIDHGPKGHDDVVMAYNLAMYVYNYGKDLKNLFGIDRQEVLTDMDDPNGGPTIVDGDQRIEGDITLENNITIRPQTMDDIIVKGAPQLNPLSGKSVNIGQGITVDSSFLDGTRALTFDSYDTYEKEMEKQSYIDNFVNDFYNNDN